MKSEDLHPLPPAVSDEFEDEGPRVSLTQLLTWVGEGKRLIAAVTVIAAVASVAVGLLLPKVYTARATFMAPGSQQQSGSAAALAVLGSLGGLVGGSAAKTPDELYVALLRGDSVQRALAQRFDLKARYDVENYETLRKKMPEYIRVSSDKKSGLITVEVDDKEPKFASELANAHAGEVSKVLGRLAVSEAQLRRIFFEKQLNDTKERLIKAEQDLRLVQEKSGVIVLDKQAEALITGAAQVRALIAEREVQLKVLRTAATDQNPEVIRLNSELRALRSELARMESAQGGNSGSAVDMPVGKLPEAAIAYVRARRELKLQETLLEGMLRQYEAAKLDEAKEGQVLQQVDIALPPDRKSKPSISLIALASTLLALLGATVFVVLRRYSAWSRELNPQDDQARSELAKAWRWRRQTR
ncbi:MAG: Wzz/FepE/Etk N-terminal domain-containing protein [Burkholderiaceae bacterium]